jgi:hypothetical protein
MFRVITWPQNADGVAVKAVSLAPAATPGPARRAASAKVERARVRQLTWALGVLGTILIGQANEFSYAYLGNGQLFSLPAFVLSIVVLFLGLRLNPRPRLGWPFGLLVVAMTYSIMIGVIVSAPTMPITGIAQEASKLCRSMFLMLCAFIGFQALDQRGRIGPLANLFTLIALPIVTYQVLAYMVGHQPTIRPTEDYTAEFRYSGIFGDPNPAAGFSVLLACIALLSTLPSWAKFALTWLALAGVLVTFSRGGLVTFAAVATVIGLLGSRGSRLGFLVAALFGVWFVVQGVPWLSSSGIVPSQAGRHLLTLHEMVTGQGELTDNTRGRLLMASLVLIGESPWVGYGYAGYRSVLGMGSHNMFSSFALLAGAFAIALYSSALASLFCAGFGRLRARARAFVISIAVWTVVMGLSIHSILHDKHAALFLTLACAVSVTRLPNIDRARANRVDQALIESSRTTTSH